MYTDLFDTSVSAQSREEFILLTATVVLAFIHMVWGCPWFADRVAGMDYTE